MRDFCFDRNRSADAAFLMQQYSKFKSRNKVPTNEKTWYMTVITGYHALAITLPLTKISNLPCHGVQS